MQSLLSSQIQECNPARPVTVFLSCGSATMLEALRALIADTDCIVVAGHSFDAAESIALVRRLQPDVLLSELRLASGAAVEVVQTVRERLLAKRIIVLAGYDSPWLKALIEKATGAQVLDPVLDCDRICGAILSAPENKD